MPVSAAVVGGATTSRLDRDPYSVSLSEPTLALEVTFTENQVNHVKLAATDDWENVPTTIK